MKIPLASLLVSLLCSLALLATASASGGRPVSFTHLYNLANNTYLSFQNIAGAHNSFANHHRPNCGQDRRKWWRFKAHKDMATIQTIMIRLSRTTSQQRKKIVYHDMLKTAHDIRGWSRGNIMPKLGTCRAMPNSSGTINQDLNNVANDLGLQRY